MNKLERKLSITISISILCIFTFSILINYYFLPRYYVYQVKKQLHAVTREIQTLHTQNLDESISNLEKKYRVTIVYETITKNEDDFNESLRESLTRKRVTLNKFWVTAKTLQQVKAGKRINKLYDQGKLKSSFLTSFIERNNLFLVVGISIVHFREAAEVINTFTIYIFGFAMIVLLLLVWIWSRKITNPLKVLTDISRDLSQLDFKKVDIQTNDEIEELADSMNKMSDALKSAHEDLKRKNQNLKIFMSDITHELKTPLSLIKAYSSGIQDGLDDGTYIQTILRQADNLSSLIDELLEFSRMEREELDKDIFNLVTVFQSCFEKHKIELQQKQFQLIVDKNRPLLIYADQNKIEKVLNNLLSNAIKYTQNQRIQVKFEEMEDEFLFTVTNGTNINENDLEKIWEPFYVIETSRNKDKTGTGLGLAIVRSILQRHRLDYGVRLSKGIIQFYIHFPKIR